MTRGVQPAAHRPDIQGLRALAVLAVVAFHAGLPIPGGFIGVDIFFVISGFVITGMLHREWVATGTIRFRRFYARRFRRLTPALALMVAVTVVAAAFIQSPLGPQQNTAITAVGAMLISANFVIAVTTGGYFDLAAETNPLLHTWSLSVEEQFYLAFPLLLLLTWVWLRRARRSRTVAFAPLAAFTIASFLLAWYTSAQSDVTFASNPFLGFYSPLTRAWEFATGALLALWLATRGTRRLPAPVAQGWGGVALIIAGCLAITPLTPFPGPATLLPVAGTLLLIASGSSGARGPSRLLSTGPFTWLGDRSYSWYLWHWPIIVFALALWPQTPLVALAAAAVSLLPAVASFRFIEQPIRRMRSVSSPRMMVLVCATMLPPLILAALLGIAAREGYWNDRVRAYQAALRPGFHLGLLSECMSRIPFAERDLEACTWNRGAEGPPIYLVGDSHADQFSESAIGAGERLRRPVTLLLAPSCPFVGVTVVTNGQPDENCRDFVHEATAYLAASPPGTVVIANADSYWAPNGLSLIDGRGAVATTSDEKLAHFQDGLRSTAEELTNAGHRVVLVQTVPTFGGRYEWDPNACRLPTIVSGGCRQSMPLEIPREAQGAARTILSSVAAQVRATELDLWADVCTGSECSVINEDEIWYFDNNHLSVPASRALVDRFVESLDAT